MRRFSRWTRDRVTSRVGVAALVLALIATLAGAVSAVAVTRSGAPTNTANAVHVTDRPSTPVPERPGAPTTKVPAAGAVVTLITGDRVRLDGPQSATLLAPAADPAAATTLTQFVWGGDLYAIPADAVPFLGKTIDPRLFDVSYLVRAGLDDAHAATLPVSISHTAAAAPGRIPAMHIGRDTGGVATASVTKAQAGGLDRLLGAQWRSRRMHHSGVNGGALAGVTAIRLAPGHAAPALPAAPPLAKPQATPNASGVHYRTLTLDFIDRNGAPASAVGWVQNVDDARLGIFVLAYPGVSGPTNYSVPEGDYSIEVSVLTPHATDPAVDGALVVKPQVTIDANTSITLDARTATQYQANLDQPVTTGTRTDILAFTRTSAADGGVRIDPYGYTGVLAILGMHLASAPEVGSPKLYASATPKVTKGTFDFQAFSELVPSETVASAKPRYYLIFPSAGRVPDSLDYTVSTAELTAAHESVYGSASRGGCTDSVRMFQMVYLPWAEDSFGVGPLVLNGNRTDYMYTSDPAVTAWQTVVNTDTCQVLWGPRRTISPGSQFTEEWNKGPGVPVAAATYAQSPAGAFGAGGANTEVTDPMLTVCAACRQDDNAVLYLQPAADSQSSHFGNDPLTSSVKYWRNGQLALTSDTLTYGQLNAKAVDLPLLTQPATYRLEWASTQTTDPATKTDTDWTFHSSAADPTGPMPPTEECAPDVGRACGYLPLLFVNYDSAVNWHDQVKAGAPFTIKFGVAHQQNQPEPTGVTATVSVSYDDGATWSAPVAGRPSDGAAFTARVTNPASAGTSGYVSVRVQATDSAGNRVIQTNTRAYSLIG